MGKWTGRNRLSWPRRKGVALFALIVAWRATAQANPRQPVTEPELVATIDRATLIRAAIERNPGIRSARSRASATRALSDADGRLPDPELGFDVWQVPFSKPYSLRDSQMISIGVKQAFPAPGSLGARSDARERGAEAEEAMADDRTRDLVRDVEHAVTDYEEAAAKEGSHRRHTAVAARIVAVAEARLAAGGTLSDVAQADVDRARFNVDAVTEAASILRARARLNAFLRRPSDAPLGAPVPRDPETVALTVEALKERAQRSRPDVRVAQKQVASEQASLRASQQEALWPMVSLGVMYFAPTTLMPEHGYGVSASASLPWLWGSAERRRKAAEASVRASTEGADDTSLRIGMDIATAATTVNVAADRLRVLAAESLPAAKRAFDVTYAAYESNRGDLLGLLSSERAVVDAEMDLVMARSSLDHALADLDWAVGEHVPRVPLGRAAAPGRPSHGGTP